MAGLLKRRQQRSTNGCREGNSYEGLGEPRNHAQAGFEKAYGEDRQGTADNRAGIYPCAEYTLARFVAETTRPAGCEQFQEE